LRTKFSYLSLPTTTTTSTANNNKGCTIQINETGTSLKLKPGLIVGGTITHDCGKTKCIGWFIEGILPLIIYGKTATRVEFTGVTNDAVDLSVDTLKNATLPLLGHFGIHGVDIKVKRRGAAPNGGGIVEFNCPIMREINAINFIEMGLIKRVRGVAFCARISPTIVSRVVESARGVLNNFLPDVYINTDHYRGSDGGASAGYSLCLFAESTSGVILTAERTSSPGELPEDVGQEGAYLLLDEIKRGGAVDSSHQSLMLQLMIMGPEDVCKVRFGDTITDQATEILRIIHSAFGLTFKIKEDEQTRTVLLSCLGLGLKNVARKIR
jgi:RNA 3'-terminal phosphate cyclase-like protein